MPKLVFKIEFQLERKRKYHFVEMDVFVAKEKVDKKEFVEPDKGKSRN